jgi:hypothetical protein
MGLINERRLQLSSGFARTFAATFAALLQTA